VSKNTHHFGRKSRGLEFNAKLDIADPGERAKRRKEAQDVVAPAVDLIERVLTK